MILDRRLHRGRGGRNLAARGEQSGGSLATLQGAVQLCGRHLRLAPERRARAKRVYRHDVRREAAHLIPWNGGAAHADAVGDWYDGQGPERLANRVQQRRREHPVHRRAAPPGACLERGDEVPGQRAEDDPGAPLFRRRGSLDRKDGWRAEQARS